MVLDGVLEWGWVEESGDLLRLTGAGSVQQEALVPCVQDVRDRVSAVLPQEDHVQLVSLLALFGRGAALDLVMHRAAGTSSTARRSCSPFGHSLLVM